MPDFLANWQPSNWCDPEEPGIAAHYTFPPGELGHFGYPKNRHGLYGPTYDLATPVGTPQVCAGYGLCVRDDAASYRRGATVTQAIGFVVDLEVLVAPAAARTVVTNGGEHRLRVDAAGTIAVTLDNGVTWTTSPASVVGRGRLYVAADHDGTNQRLWINRRIVAQSAAVLSVPAGGNLDVGQHGTVRRLVLPSSWVERIESRYRSELANRVIWKWEPRDVGAGPTVGIQTYDTGRGCWRCPQGSANLKFQTRFEENGTPYLAIHTTGVGQPERLEWDCARPAFGSWLVEYEPASLAAAGAVFNWGLYGLPGVYFVGAGSNCYRLCGQTVGAVWRLTLHRDAGAAILTVDAPLPVDAAPWRCMKALLTRHPSGDFRLWSYVGGAWYGTDQAIVNDVTYLAHNNIGVSPQNVYVRRMTHLQGELTPVELPVG